MERGYLCSFAGNVTYPSATDLQAAARQVPEELLLVETDSPFLAPVPRRGRPNEPANVVHTARFVAAVRGVSYEAHRAHRGGQRRAGVRLVSEPRQASLRRLRQFEVRPNRELGQNFLIDDNLLGVIERAAELAAGDVVLEVGGGLGVLSEHLAPRVGHLHVVEIDPSLEPALRDALDPFAEHDAPHGRRGEARPRGARPGAHEGRGQPALRRGRHGDPGDDRPAARGHALGGHGPARGGGAPRRRSRGPGVRRHLGARAARVRRARASPRAAHRVPPGSERGLRPRRPAPARPGAATGGPQPRARRVRAPAQGAGRIAGPRARAARPSCGTRRAPPWRRSACPRTPGPSGSGRTSGRAWPPSSAPSWRGIGSLAPRGAEPDAGDCRARVREAQPGSARRPAARGHAPDLLPLRLARPGRRPRGARAARGCG